MKSKHTRKPNQALPIILLLLPLLTFGASAYAESGGTPTEKQNVVSQQSSEQSEPSVVMGANAAGAARVNNLANLEALLNIFANGFEAISCYIGGPLCAAVPVGLVFLFIKGRRLLGLLFLIVGPSIVGFGVALPGILNLLVASARDANLFD
jgi:hypothetical protein